MAVESLMMGVSRTGFVETFGQPGSNFLVVSARRPEPREGAPSPLHVSVPSFLGVQRSTDCNEWLSIRELCQ
jgi:hypothetical protein